MYRVDDELVSVMNSVARALTASGEPDDILDAITKTALEVVADTDYASISVVTRDGQMKTVSPTDDVIRSADQLQYTLGEGPCVDAAEHQETLRSPDVANDPRWPRYGPRAAELGLCSQMAIELFATSRSRAALNLYSTTPGAYDESSLIPELFATHAAVAMGFAQEAETLHEAIRTRQAIGQAVGIVMEKYDVDEDRAFSFLVRVSQRSNLKLRRVAEDVIAQVNADAK